MTVNVLEMTTNVIETTKKENDTMNRKFTTRDLVIQALVAATYVGLTWALPVFSYGAIQFRIAEVMTLLAFFNPSFIYGLTIACIISNLLSPFGMIDVVFGSLATFVALFAMSKIKNIWIASLMPAFSAFIIALGIIIASQEPSIYFIVSGEIFVSQFLVVTVIGVPVFKMLMQNDKFNKAVLSN